MNFRDKNLPFPTHLLTLDSLKVTMAVKYAFIYLYSHFINYLVALTNSWIGTFQVEIFLVQAE